MAFVPTPGQEHKYPRLYSNLQSHEIAWRDRQPFLESRGYMLRPRYHPGWTPSWLTTGEHPRRCEDGIPLHVRVNLIDATRISDGRLVYIKRVETGDEETRIVMSLYSKSDSRNHCVPILEHFEDSETHSISYIVMPFLCEIDEPPFAYVDEVLEMVDQLLEGLCFIHDNGIAHRDCSERNLMMDGYSLYPLGHHPVRTLYLADARTPSYYRTRTEVPVKYYYIDFGISVFIPQDVHPKLTVGGYGQDQEVPELSFDIPYDPFKVDVFILGNMFRRKFYNVFSNLDFLMPLIQAMTQTDPSLRPNAIEALQQWQNMRKRVGFLHRRWRLRSRDDSWSQTIVYDVAALFNTAVYIVKGLWPC